MRKVFRILLLLFVIFCTIFTTNGQTFYGYRIRPSAGMGFVSFPAENTGNLTQINTYRDFDDLRFDYNTISAGEFVKGDFYYNSYYPLGGVDYAGRIMRLSTDNWQAVKSNTLNPSYGFEGMLFWLSDMSYNYAGNTLYGLTSYNNSWSYLFSIDTETLEYTLLHEIHAGLLTLAFDLDGTCYSMARNGKLYTLNIATGEATEIGSSGITLTAAYFQSMSFDHHTGKLYWATLNSATDGSLYEVNKATGAAIRIGPIGTGSEIAGLHTIYYPHQIPGRPANLTVTPEASDALSATLSWDNPATAKSGETLNGLSSVVVKRNGVIVHTVNNPAVGGHETWTDNTVPKKGDYVYTVYGIANGDSGWEAGATVVVGTDDCDVTSFPYSVGFESPAEIACMKGYSMGENEAGISTAAARTGNSSWRFSSGGSATDYTQYLISPRLAPTSNEKTIRFYYNTLTHDTERFWVGYSTTDNKPESFRWTDFRSLPATGGWVEYSNTFPPDTKYIAIRYNVVFRWFVYIDDLTIDVLADKDAEIADIVSPVSSGGLTASENVTVRLRNSGAQTLTSIPLTLEVNGVSIASETATVSLSKLQETNYTFTAKADLALRGNHTVKVTASLSGDEKPENNTRIVQIKNFGDCVFTLPFTEPFEDAADLACWTITPSQTNTPKISGIIAHNGKQSWRFTSENNPGADNNQYLITPRLAASGKDKRLELFLYVPNNTTEYFRIGYVTADVMPTDPDWQSTNMHWSNLEFIGNNRWVPLSGVFPADAKYIVFNYYASNARGSLYIDDVTLRDASEIDVAVSAIVSPASGGDLGQERVKIKVSNAGMQTVSNIPVKFEVNGVVAGSGTVPGPITPDNEVEYTFSSNANLSVEGIYNIKAYISKFVGDDNPLNDTLSLQVTNYGACKITSLPFETGFEEELTPCWGNFDLDNDFYGHRWTRDKTTAHAGEFCYSHSVGTNQDGWLVTPKIVIPSDVSNSSIFLEFYQYVSGSSSGKNSVWISTGSGRPENGDFEEIWHATSFPPSWEKVLLSLYAYAGQEIYIAFRYEGTNSSVWHIDDVRIFEQSGKDAAVTAIISPRSGSGLTQETVTVKVRNEGAVALAGIPVKLEVNGTAVGNEIIQSTVNPFTETTYTFTAKADISAKGAYTIKVCTAVEGDNNAGNDAKSIVVYNGGSCEVTEMPYRESFEIADLIGEDRFICWTLYSNNAIPENQWVVASNFKSDSGSKLAPQDGNKLAYHNYSLREAEDNDWLVSPQITLPADERYSLSFWSFNAYTADYGSHGKYFGKNSVWISTGSANPADGDFVEVWSPKTVSASWVKSDINLADYAGKKIYIAFNYSANNGHSWVLDNISIESLADKDAGVTQILSPVSGGNASAQVIVNVGNFGAKPITELSVAYQFKNDAPVTQQFTGLNIASGKTATLTFDQTVDVSKYQETYTLRVYTILEGDANASNDETTATFKYRENFSLYGYQLDFDGATAQYQLNPVSFTIVDPKTETVVSDFRDGSYLVTAGEYYNDHIYLFTRKSGSAWAPGNFVTLDKNWNEVSKSAATDMPDDITYDYSTNTMYATVQVPYDGVTYQSDLKTVDLETGATTTVARLSKRLRTLAASQDGNLYGIARDGNLCIIDKQTGQITDLGTTPVDPSSELQSMTFDHLSGELYWASYDVNYRGRLVELNLNDPSQSVILGTIGKNSQIVGLFSVYPRRHVGIIPAGDNRAVVVYPNPAENVVHISSVPAGSVISLMDMTGKTLQASYGSGDVTLHFNLPKGIYLIQVKNENTQIIRRLIVK